MEKINELIALAQQIDSVMDDSGGTVYSLDISQTNGRCRFLIEPDEFLAQFEHADMVKRHDAEIPVVLETEIEGVVFRAYVHSNEIELLRGQVSDQWLDDTKKTINASEGIYRIEPANKKSPLALACE
ncbi:hypothetical protein [Sporosarcina newyorkensis]|uniref:Uncharacterized protein n=1 Tax=Sporosarcina newyorkensis TaxID=759851 RepID=A0A1T4YUG5_9BACL|nr:hypothetical protein [Sporosarcina newyorkensis]SKB05238.1 hypothetical protein SAMN04244570_3593 [Sporosarcina newyorkensis]